MRVFTTLSAVSVLLAAPLAAPGGAVAAAAEPGVVLLNVTGSGCKHNTPKAALSPDRAAFTITYSAYILVPSAGSANPLTKDCRINLMINPIPGYAPTITSVDYRGFADLGAGSVTQLTAHYGFHGATHVESAALRLTGGFSDVWETTDTAQGGLVTGSCSGSNVVDIDSELSLTSNSAGDYVAMDSTDGSTGSKKAVGPNTFHLTWKRCS